MVTIRNSLQFLLLSILIQVSLIEAEWQRNHRDDLCDIYNRTWTCDAQHPVFQDGGHHHPRDAPQRLIPRDDSHLCDVDLVGTTLALMEEGDAMIELTENEEAVLVIGNTGTGKSTLTYFLAGNNSALISYSVDFYINLIKDCNGKIGDSTVVSQTFFPDLVVEEVTNTAFYDNPGFQDTRTPCMEIANAYFMKKVVNHVKKVKFVIVENHASMVVGGPRLDIIHTLKNVLSFIPNLQKYLPSVALVGTKANSEGRDIYLRVRQMSQFLNQTKPNLPEVFTEPELTLVNNLFDTLNEKAADGNFTRMHVFRTPEECGPLSDIEHMRENRADIMSVVMNNLKYTESSPSDFGPNLSSYAQLVISKAISDLNAKVVESLDQLSKELLEHLRPQFESQCTPADPSGCDLLIRDLSRLFSNPEFDQDYSDQCAGHGVSFARVIGRLINPVYFPTGFDLSSNSTESLNKYGRHLDMLNTLQPLSGYVEISTWLQPLKSLKLQLIQNIREAASKWNNNPAFDLMQILATNLERFIIG